MTYSFFIPGSLPGMNEIITANRSGKHIGAAQKVAAEKVIMYSIRKARLLPIKDYPISMRITWIERNGRRDPDNVAAAKKFILDALQRTGILRNDGRREIDSLHDYFQTDKRKPGILVELEEVQLAEPDH